MNLMKKILSLMVWGLVILIGVVPAWAITADEILDEVEARTAESETQKAIAKMILVDSKGREEVREVIMYAKDEGEDVISIIVRFLSPADVKMLLSSASKGREHVSLHAGL